MASSGSAEASARCWGPGPLGGGKRWFLSLGNVVEFCLRLPLLPLSALYTLVRRFYLAKLFFADRRCNGWGVCARRCSEKAIVMKRGRSYWTFKCESCMRCMAFSLERAVEAGHRLALCIAWGTVLLFGGWSRQEWVNGSMGMILRGASWIVLPWGQDAAGGARVLVAPPSGRVLVQLQERLQG